MPTAKVFTRRELYDLVWSKPVTEVAAELGISDVGLAKICDRHRVPKPSRGYWAKLQAGKKVKQTIFREVDDAALNRIEIGSAHYHLLPAAREIIERAKAEHRKAKPSSRTTVEPASIEPITEVHPLITPTAKALRKARPDENGAVQAYGNGRCGVDVAAANVERVITFLNALEQRLGKISEFIATRYWKPHSSARFFPICVAFATCRSSTPSKRLLRAADNGLASLQPPGWGLGSGFGYF